jgi:hypothetical protein
VKVLIDENLPAEVGGSVDRAYNELKSLARESETTLKSAAQLALIGLLASCLVLATSATITPKQTAETHLDFGSVNAAGNDRQ